MNLYQNLRKLGLTKYEAKVYQAMLLLGKSEATTIAKHSKVPITAVYPSLKELTHKKLVQKFEGETSTFQAANATRALKEYVERKKEVLKDLEEQTITLSQALENKKPQENKKRKVLEIGTGKEFSKNIYFETFEHAKKTIDILGWRFQKISDKYQIIHPIKKAIKKGVRVRLILIGEKHNKKRELIKAYKQAGVQIKFLPLEDFSILITDTTSCKITIKKRGEEKTNINIIDENLTKAMKQYYETLWKKAEKI